MLVVTIDVDLDLILNSFRGKTVSSVTGRGIEFSLGPNTWTSSGSNSPFLQEAATGMTMNVEIKIPNVYSRSSERNQEVEAMRRFFASDKGSVAVSEGTN